MKAIFILLAVLFLVLQYKLWFAAGGVSSVKKLHQQILTEQEKNQRLEDRNTALAAEVRDLKHGRQALEERARHDLGMVKKEEQYYQFVN